MGWPTGLNYPGGVEYDCNGDLDPDAWGDWDFQTLAAKYLSGAKIDIWTLIISNYESQRSQDRQLNHNEQVWWYFLYGDRPPLPNPTVMDRPGIEARITPWAAWLERVQGLVYYSTTDWTPIPWTQPWINDGNGDGFMFYPPRDGTIAFNACDAQSNRLVPSIRWELLREGMEDYEYFWILNKGNPRIGVSNAADALIGKFVSSRTLFSRVPIDLYQTRADIAATITGKPIGEKKFLPFLYPLLLVPKK